MGQADLLIVRLLMAVAGLSALARYLSVPYPRTLCVKKGRLDAMTVLSGLSGPARRLRQEVPPRARAQPNGQNRNGDHTSDRAARLGDDEIIELCRRAKNAPKF